MSTVAAPSLWCSVPAAQADRDVLYTLIYKLPFHCTVYRRHFQGSFSVRGSHSFLMPTCSLHRMCL